MLSRVGRQHDRDPAAGRRDVPQPGERDSRSGYPRGPLRMMDDIGAPRVLAGLAVMHARYGDPAFAPVPLLAEYATAGNLFRTSAEG